MENKQIGCINRDENAVNNMIKIVNHYLNKKERLLKYRRDYDLEKGELKAETKQKVITPIKNDTKNWGVKYQPSSKWVQLHWIRWIKCPNIQRKMCNKELYKKIIDDMIVIYQTEYKNDETNNMRWFFYTNDGKIHIDCSDLRADDPKLNTSLGHL